VIFVRRIFYTAQFKKDLKRIQKQNKDAAKLKAVIANLASGQALDEKYNDQPLHGNYTGVRDCHIAPNWLLINAIVGDELRLSRTGSHAELLA
jgi:mRNA interferase YafQ